MAAIYPILPHVPLLRVHLLTIYLEGGLWGAVTSTGNILANFLSVPLCAQAFVVDHTQI